MVYEYYWRAKNKKLLTKEIRLREVAKSLGLSKEAKHRLEWFIFHELKCEQNVSLTCRHFDIG